MSDDAVVENAAEETQPEAGSETQTVEELTAKLEHWKYEARKQETRAKENADAAKRLAEIEDANKSETQKVTEERDRLAVQVTEYQVRDIRTQAAVDAGLPMSSIQYITAVDSETAAEQAKGLAALVNHSKEPVTPQEPLYVQGYQGKGEKRGASVAGGRDMYAERHKK